MELPIAKPIQHSGYGRPQQMEFISITKITNQEQEKIEKSYTKEDAIQIGTTKLEKIIEDEIGTNKNIIDKKVDVIEIDNYIEVNVTYEIIENIGIQEKIE